MSEDWHAVSRLIDELVAAGKVSRLAGDNAKLLMVLEHDGWPAPSVGANDYTSAVSLSWEVQEIEVSSAEFELYRLLPGRTAIQHVPQGEYRRVSSLLKALV
jgi:hypothetical protein